MMKRQTKLQFQIILSRLRKLQSQVKEMEIQLTKVLEKQTTVLEKQNIQGVKRSRTGDFDTNW